LSICQLCAAPLRWRDRLVHLDAGLLAELIASEALDDPAMHIIHHLGELARARPRRSAGDALA